MPPSESLATPPPSPGHLKGDVQDDHVETSSATARQADEAEEVDGLTEVAAPKTARPAPRGPPRSPALLLRAAGPDHKANSAGGWRWL